MSFLVLHGVGKRYGAVPAVEDVGFSVAHGSRTAIVGPSGSGKTTLLRIIAGFETPDTGSVSLDGEDLARDGRAVPAYRRGVGVVSQDGALFPHLSIADNIGFGIDRRAPDRAERIASLMDLVGLGRTMLARKPDELSGGQQQRVALARALARRPRLMLLDEPFSALDTALRASTRKAVADMLTAAGITSILVTHDQVEALSFADQVAVMRNGRLLQVGSPRDLYCRPVDRTIAEFLGDAIILPARLRHGEAVCALGRVAVDAPGCEGPATIMLRPEQESTDRPGAVPAVVLDIDFGGASCTCKLRLLFEPDHSEPLVLRVPSSEILLVGACVAVSVMGQAHVFTA
jgi:iron(III) transport system ATP-binding protein